MNRPFLQPLEKLSGLYIWGDVAYDHGMFFSPDYWRRVYQPQVKRICAAGAEYPLPSVQSPSFHS